ncbi:alpha-L-arabinofuranosidase C-terminal domain-containing protein [Sunxiuqinia sp. A32]|uniref:alpha-L-arabinofuranosidase C-terminal domain-containing protein n=1 Tax=Sunxiuqinia sp. A32 TaxID=3461496 RepID=UPI004045B7EF
MKRRDFLRKTGIAGTTIAIASSGNRMFASDVFSSSMIKVDPSPKFELSPWLYMQFMEPLGVTDSSVEAAWNHEADSWRKDVVDVTAELAPGMMRWGGLLSAYYKWKEAVGPRNERIPMRNLVWGGIESNQVGTAEFVDFCKQVKADPLICVNFESEGYANWAKTPKGEVRFADAKEAAEWVDYCNNPSNAKRISHGAKDPYNVNVWQIGNETSYAKDRFNLETAAKKTIEFAKAMRGADSSIKIIGWGDSGWTKKMIEYAGDQMDYVAFHHMFDPGQDIKDSVIVDNQYRYDPDATWDILMNGYKIHERKILEIREQAEPFGKQMALTECHYSIRGRNRCEILSSWAAGVSYARMMNLHERHGDLLKIATLADFCGNRWQVNAIMIPVPGGKSFMMPVAKIMSLYKKYSGKEYIQVTDVPEGLDITASRTGNKIYLHVVNVNRTKSVKTSVGIANMEIKSGKAYEIAADPEFEIMRASNDPLIPKEKVLDINDLHEFPAASVTAVELDVV